MKTFFTILNWLFIITTSVYSQNVQLNFTGTGASSTVETVKIENLTQGTSITVNGNEAIMLIETNTGTNPVNVKADNVLSIYPNPVTDNSSFDFTIIAKGNTAIELLDVAGKRVASYQHLLEAGTHTFHIQNLKGGVYILSIRSQGYTYSGKLVSNGYASGVVVISYGGFSSGKVWQQKLKSTTTGGTMQFKAGDILKFTGTSGIYSTIVMDEPAQNKTITFLFVACIDGDNNNYPVVQIGDRLWMAENLKTTKYNNGTIIPLVTNNAIWQNLSTGAYSWYNNNETLYKKTYGALYNWYSMDTKNICPAGWHVPTNNEWSALETYLGGYSVAGGKMKEVGIAQWDSPNTDATNSSGFSALPGGGRIEDGSFTELGIGGYFWSSSQASETEVCGRGLWYDDAELNGDCDTFKNYGLSVRCIRDNPDSVHVTFQVDMKNEQVSSLGVFLNGSFCNWVQYVKMAPTGEGSIYVTTLKLKVYDIVTYKYINGMVAGSLSYENATDTCSVDGYHNRMIVVPNKDAVVGLTCYNGCGACKTLSTDSVYVTFQVDMQNEVVSSNGVKLTGSFNNWLDGVSMNPVGNGSIYTATLKLREEDEVSYKYVNGYILDWLVYENATDTCSADNYYNRTITVPEKDVVLGVTCYRGCGSCPSVTGDSVKVTFRVSMKNETVSPAGVFLNGSFCGWNEGVAMIKDIYDHYYKTITLKKGAIIEYKFVNGETSNLANYENITGICAYGTQSNRRLVVGQQRLFLDLVYFGSCDNVFIKKKP
jgi:uncharacterized protein (TIGR02145 family)